MPTAEVQRHLGFAAEATIKPGSPIFHRHEQPPFPLAIFSDESADYQATGWESLWIDMGGEG